MTVECWTISISPDGKNIISGTHSGNVNMWNIENGEKVTTFETRGKFVMAVAYVNFFSLLLEELYHFFFQINKIKIK